MPRQVVALEEFQAVALEEFLGSAAVLQAVCLGARGSR